MTNRRPEPTPVAFETLVSGFDEAHARLRAAMNKGSDVAKAFIPLFEALHWAVAISNREEARSMPEDDQKALRHARNRVGHQWACALEVGDVVTPSRRRIGGDRRDRHGGSVTWIEPTSVRLWKWLPEAELPRPPKQHHHQDQEDAYRAKLEGQPAHDVLDRFSEALRGSR